MKDLPNIVIEDTPYTGKIVRGKYDSLFEKLKPGQCMRVQREDVSKITSALQQWLKKKGKTGRLRARSVENCEDGYGRVWMLNVPIKMADVPARKITKLDIEP